MCKGEEKEALLGIQTRESRYIIFPYMFKFYYQIHYYYSEVSIYFKREEIPMKKKLFAILTASFLVFGVAGVSFGTISPQSSELPNIY
jgi:hypothetical protein